MSLTKLRGIFYPQAISFGVDPTFNVWRTSMKGTVAQIDILETMTPIVVFGVFGARWRQSSGFNPLAIPRG